MSRRLPNLDFTPARGLNTKFNPEVLAGQYLGTSRNADGFDSYLGWGQVPGSSRKSDKAPSGWEWLSYFQYFDLNRSLTRNVVGIAGTQLFRVNSDKSLTALQTGYTAEPHYAITTLDRIHVCSESDEPFKFDGAYDASNTAVGVTRWGVGAPGSDETVLEAFDDESNFTISTSDTKADESTITRDTASVLVNKLSTTAQEAKLTRAYGGTQDFSSPDGKLYGWLYLPGGALLALESTYSTTQYAVAVRFSNGASYQEFRFGIGSLVEGWNLLEFDSASTDTTYRATSGTPSLTIVDKMDYSLFTRSNSTTYSGFVWDRLYSPSRGTPSGILTTSGSIAADSTVQYRVTFLSRYGQESNAGPSSASFTHTGTFGVILTDIPVSSEPQVIARRLYRNLNGDGIFGFIKQIDDNTTTGYIDIAADYNTNLLPPLAGDVDDDNSPPPRMIAPVLFHEHVFAINEENRFELLISAESEPESFPLLRRRQFDQELVAIVKTPRGLLLMGTDRNIPVTGDSYPFTFGDGDPEIGASGPRAATDVKRFAVTWHDDGPYVHDGSSHWYIGNPIKNQIEDLDPTLFSTMFQMHDRGRFRLLSFLESSASGTYDKVFSYGYGGSMGTVSSEGSGVEPLDVRNGAWTELVLPSTVNPKCAAVIEQSADRPELWVGAADGYLYRLQDTAETDWAVGTGTESVACEWESLPAPFSSEDHDLVGEPRYLTISTETIGAEATWTATVTTLTGPKGSVLDTKTVTFSLSAGASESEEVPITGGMHRGPWVKVKLASTTAGSRTIFHAVRLHFIRGRHRAVRAA